MPYTPPVIDFTTEQPMTLGMLREILSRIPPEFDDYRLWFEDIGADKYVIGITAWPRDPEDPNHLHFNTVYTAEFDSEDGEEE